MPDDSPTFAELGIPFPLFEGPVSEAADYAGRADSSICGRRDVHCFELGIGADVIVDCAYCGERTAVDAADECGDCHLCGHMNALADIWPNVDGRRRDGRLLTCYRCLREDRAAYVHDTERGAFFWDDPENTPGSDHAELVHTPGFLAWQEPTWLFHCDRLMTFLGTWQREHFDRHAPDGDGRAWFLDIVDDALAELWPDAIEAPPDAGGPGVYMFRCRQCGTRRGYWDMY